MPQPSSAAPTRAPVATRIAFVVELARRLHEYGTAAPRLEDVVNGVSGRLGLGCNVLSTPTSIVMSFTDPAREDDAAEITQVVRVPPGEVNLKRLCQVDEIGDQVVSGELDLAAGRRRLREFAQERRGRVWYALTVASFGVSAGSVAAIFHTGWAGVWSAALIGCLIGLLNVAAVGRPNIGAALEALSALVAVFVATAIAVHVTPLAVRSVVIASLIVLMPGMTLTTAVRELSSQHLVSGTARMMGAIATLLKLAFGTVLATQLCGLLGWVPSASPEDLVPAWVEWIAVPCGALAFAVLFGSPLRHVGVVVGAVATGFLCAQLGGIYVSSSFGVFIGGLVIGAGSNVFARLMRRPGALIREPGIILLVPGSVGFRSLSLVFDRDVMLGIDTAVVVVTLLVAIVAGLLFGDLLVPPRRSL